MSKLTPQIWKLVLYLSKALKNGIMSRHGPYFCRDAASKFLPSERISCGLPEIWLLFAKMQLSMKRENQADTLSSLAVLVSSAELQEFLSHWMTVNLCTLLAEKGNMKICEEHMPSLCSRINATWRVSSVPSCRCVFSDPPPAATSMHLVDPTFYQPSLLLSHQIL